MKIFNLVKDALEKIKSSDELVNFANIQKENNLLFFRQISERGQEQDILPKIFKAKNISERFFGYISWIAGELMNNVFDHGQTLGKTLRGGILALDIKDKLLELAVGDLGIGIKASLEKHPSIQEQRIDGKKALELAISENISGWPNKRGNGLPDVLRIVGAGSGRLMIYSDKIILSRINSRKAWKEVDWNLSGVVVGLELAIDDFDVPRRTRPRGKVFKLVQFGKQLSGRDKGQKAYEELVRELVSLPESGSLLIDLSGVVMMNSSFADQALGVLLENIARGDFGSKKIYFIGDISEVVMLGLDRVAEIRKLEPVIL